MTVKRTTTRTIKVDALARVEGEGAITITFKGRVPLSAQLRIFEPPRFFEGFLQGRAITEVPDLTARICGICPVAYQMSSVHALERALGVTVTPEIRALRRLLYCGEWIESHVLHMVMLHAPDFLGFPDGITLAKTHGDLVRNALRVKKAGNAMVRLLGGREIHPINVRLGGFYKVPDVDKFRAMVPELTWARDTLCAIVKEMARWNFPDFERDHIYVSLRHPDEYPFNEGRVVSSNGLDIPVDAWDQHFREEHVQHSTALHCGMVGHGPYLVGPLARFNLNADKLRPVALALARDIGLKAPVHNPFKMLLVRGVETVHALDEALGIIAEMRPRQQDHVPCPPRAGVGMAATEAPRGLLFHHYRVDDEGLVETARIVPPTSQNQPSIEKDLLAIAARLPDMDHAAATTLAEQTVRNHDPCISCSTHFLKLTLRQEQDPIP